MNVKTRAVTSLKRKARDEAMDALLSSIEPTVPLIVLWGAQAAKNGQSMLDNPYQMGFDHINWWAGWVLEASGKFPWDRPVASV